MHREEERKEGDVGRNPGWHYLSLRSHVVISEAQHHPHLSQSLSILLKLIGFVFLALSVQKSLLIGQKENFPRNCITKSVLFLDVKKILLIAGIYKTWVI